MLNFKGVDKGSLLLFTKNINVLDKINKKIALTLIKLCSIINLKRRCNI